MMLKKLFVLMVCVFLIVTGSTTHAELSCKVDGCDTCEPGASCICKKCKEDYDLTIFGECYKKEKCSIRHCTQCSSSIYPCSACEMGYTYNYKTESCDPLPYCNVEHCSLCHVGSSSKCLDCEMSYESSEDERECIKKNATCYVDNCQTCDYCNKSACVTCKSGFHVTKDNKCATGSSGDLAAYRVTYLLYFAILLMTAVIVAQKV